jgi:hypothetical protein
MISINTLSKMQLFINKGCGTYVALSIKGLTFLRYILRIYLGPEQAKESSR